MEQAYLYYPASDAIRNAITLVAHGLNMRPLAMEPLIQWLNSCGSDVYLIQLSGHHYQSVDIKDVTPSLWQEEMLAGYRQAKQAATDHKLPLFFLGYSLGALLGQSMIALKQGKDCFDKQVLIAPATVIRYRTYLMKFISLFNRKRLQLSYTPKPYKVNEALPLSIYNILFTEEKTLRKAKASLCTIPLLIIIDPKDELISYARLQRLINRFRLTQQQVLLLDNDLKNRKGRYHHLVIDELTMGPANWQLCINTMKRFLFGATGD